MKKILLVLTALTALNIAFADENTPVNFHKDQRLAQFNVSIKMTDGGTVTTFDQKICFVQGGLRDRPIDEKFDQGCSVKKIKDSDTDLEYLVTCSGKPDTTMHWFRISVNEFSFLSKSSQSEVTSTYKYVGINCDSDAIRK